MRFLFTLAMILALASTNVLAQSASDFSQYDDWPYPRDPANPDGLKVFLYGSLKTHGPGAHDYPYWMDTWSKMLTDHGAIVDGSFSFPSADQLANTDVLFIYRGDAGYMTAEQRANLQKYLQRGGGIATLHDSICGPNPEDWASILGGAKKHGELNYTWTATLDYEVVDEGNPIIEDMPMQVYDEAFFKMTFAEDIHPILSVTMPDTPTSIRAGYNGKTIPQMWTYEHSVEGSTAPARSFVWMQGHMIDNIDNPSLRDVVMRGIAWAGKRPYNELTDYVAAESGH